MRPCGALTWVWVVRLSSEVGVVVRSTLRGGS